jgi:translation initiation factor IF-2
LAAKKPRVHELAKEFGLTNKELLELAARKGVDAKSASSSIDEAQADRLRRIVDDEGLRREVQPEEPTKKKAPAKKAAAKKKADDDAPVEPIAKDEPTAVAEPVSDDTSDVPKVVRARTSTVKPAPPKPAAPTTPQAPTSVARSGPSHRRPLRVARFRRRLRRVRRFPLRVARFRHRPVAHVAFAQQLVVLVVPVPVDRVPVALVARELPLVAAHSADVLAAVVLLAVAPVVAVPVRVRPLVLVVVVPVVDLVVAPAVRSARPRPVVATRLKSSSQPRRRRGCRATLRCPKARSSSNAAQRPRTSVRR